MRINVHKPKTNVDLVVNLMEFSPVGAMGQMFVVEAIRKYADQCASPQGQAKLRESMKGGMINAESWIKAAVHIKERCDKFYSAQRGPIVRDITVQAEYGEPIARYTVRDGDKTEQGVTLRALEKRYGLTGDDLERARNLKAPHVIDCEVPN